MKKYVAATLTVVLFCGVCGCQSSATQDSSQKLAVSQKDYVALLLQQTDGRTPDSVKDTLQRALDHDGTISQQDYNQAWQNFSWCIVDRGYSQPVLFTLSNGMKELAPIDAAHMQPEERDKLLQEDEAAYMDHVTLIQSLV